MQPKKLANTAPKTNAKLKQYTVITGDKYNITGLPFINY
jgi:hypothetical protein